MLLVMNSAHWPSTVVSTARILLAVSKAKQTVCDRRRRYTGRGPPRNTTGTAAVSPTSGGRSKKSSARHSQSTLGALLALFPSMFLSCQRVAVLKRDPWALWRLASRKETSTNARVLLRFETQREKGEACDGHPLTAGGVPQSWQTRRACTAAASASGALAEARHAPPRQTPVAAPSG